MPHSRNWCPGSNSINLNLLPLKKYYFSKIFVPKWARAYIYRQKHIKGGIFYEDIPKNNILFSGIAGGSCFGFAVLLSADRLQQTDGSGSVRIPSFCTLDSLMDGLQMEDLIDFYIRQPGPKS